MKPIAGRSSRPLRLHHLESLAEKQHSYFAALYDEQYPNEVDQFEDLLCGMLRIHRHPATSLDEWRVQRVRGIEETR